MTTAKKPAATKTKKPTTRAKTVKVAPIVELPKNPFAFEVFDLVSKQRTKAKKVEVLKKYEHISLKVCLIWNFDDTVQSVLPEGDVPFASMRNRPLRVDHSVRNWILKLVECMSKVISLWVSVILRVELPFVESLRTSTCSSKVVMMR